MDIFVIIISLAILVYSAILHELAHGFVADKLGDPTPRLSGRLTLNPRAHIDPFMSILLPLMLFLSSANVLFGGAKPVPVDPYNLREGRKDIALVALAGPLTNILLAIMASLLLKGVIFLAAGQTPTEFFLHIIGKILAIVVDINILLAVFNLLPIPPLDGSKIFALLLPQKQATAYLSFGQFGIVILLLLLFFPIAGFSLIDLVHNLKSFAESLLFP